MDELHETLPAQFINMTVNDLEYGAGGFIAPGALKLSRHGTLYIHPNTPVEYRRDDKHPIHFVRTYNGPSVEFSSTLNYRWRPDANIEIASHIAIKKIRLTPAVEVEQTSGSTAPRIGSGYVIDRG